MILFILLSFLYKFINHNDNHKESIRLLPKAPFIDHDNHGNDQFDSKNDIKNVNYNLWNKLLNDYFEPFKFITEKEFNALSIKALNFNTCRGSSVIIQVLKGKIYVDKSHWKTIYPWDTLRLHFILNLLQKHVLNSNNNNSKIDTNSSFPLPDFEFILVIFPFLFYLEFS